MQSKSVGFKAVVLFRSKKNGNIISRVSKKTFNTSHEALQKALVDYYRQNLIYRAVTDVKITFKEVKVKKSKTNPFFLN